MIRQKKYFIFRSDGLWIGWIFADSRFDAEWIARLWWDAGIFGFEIFLKTTNAGKLAVNDKKNKDRLPEQPIDFSAR